MEMLCDRIVYRHVWFLGLSGSDNGSNPLPRIMQWSGGAHGYGRRLTRKSTELSRMKGRFVAGRIGWHRTSPRGVV